MHYLKIVYISEMPLDDLYEDYRAPQLQEIPGRIQGLPPKNSKNDEKSLLPT